MCGIAGLWHFDGMNISPPVLQAMTDALSHRGPDGHGIYVEGTIGLGHRRLAILDLSPTGHQPMSYADGRYWITYNGEVYNFLELRQELEGLGHSFLGTNDTEVILAAYDQWGPACLNRFNGMWAFAIWDARERTMFLARDRFGIKPLFYLRQPESFAFASEWKAFLALPGLSPRVDWSTFTTALHDPYCQEGISECLVEDVRRLLPGHYMLVRLHEIRISRWWCTHDHLVETPSSLSEQAKQFRELFVDACRLRMRSDVPIGTCLSGGLDSSSIVSALAAISADGACRSERLAQDWQQAFIATFPDTPVDERAYADLVVRHAGVQAHYVTPSPKDFLSHIEDVVFHLEALDSGLMIQLWTIYSHLRQANVVVTLDGHGGDELLGGYSSHVIAALQASGKRGQWPGRYLELLRTYEAMYRPSPGSMRPGQGRMSLVSTTNGWAQMAQRWFGRAGLRWPVAADRAPSVSDFITADARGIDRTPGPQDIWIAGMDELGFVFYRLFHQTMLPTILRNFDRMSMAHGVEIRMPFMDWRLVQYGFSLPPESKIGRSYTKLVLREAMRGMVPEPVLVRRDKLGFTPPLADWFRYDLSDWLLDLMTSRMFLDNPLWDGAALRNMVETGLHDRSLTWNTLSIVWPFVHAALWLKRFDTAPKTEVAT